MRPEVGGIHGELRAEEVEGVEPIQHVARVERGAERARDGRQNRDPLGLHVHALDGHRLRGRGDRHDAVGTPEVAPETDAAAAFVGIEELRIDEVLEVVRDDDVREPGFVELRGAQRAQEDVGAEPLQRRAIRGGELEERLEKAVQPAARAQEAARFLDVETGAETPEDGALREERPDDSLGCRFDEQVELVRVRPFEQGFQKAQDEHTRSAVAAIRRQGSEVDEDPQAPPL